MQENSQTINVGFDPFADENISETAPEATPAPAQVVEETKKETTTEPAKQETSAEVIETPANPIKEKLGFETIEDAAAEMQRLRDSATTKEEIKFANEQSQKLYDYLREGKTDEVYAFLDTQRKISSAADMEAEKAIKLHLELTNRHYTAADVQDVFEERYSLPKEPSQRLDETDEEFAERQAEWKGQQEKVQRRINRDAIEAKQALSKLSTELVLPEIQKQQAANPELAEAQRKESERLEQVRQSYLSSLESEFKNFDGFKVEYKDEEVSIPISFGVSEQERLEQKEVLKSFNLDEFIGSRWFSADGKANIHQIQQDIYLLQNRDKVFSKLVNEAGTKRLAEHLKKAANISVNGQGAEKTYQPAAKSLADQVWGG